MSDPRVCLPWKCKREGGGGQIEKGMKKKSMFPTIPQSLGHLEVTTGLVANWGKAASSNCLVLRVFVLLAGECRVLNISKALRNGGWGGGIPYSFGMTQSI